MYTSEGSSKLAALVADTTYAAVAKRAGVCEPSVRAHATGERVPLSAARKKYAAIGVPFHAWNARSTPGPIGDPAELVRDLAAGVREGAGRGT